MRVNETTEVSPEAQRAFEVDQLFSAITKVVETELVFSAAKQETVILRAQLIRKYGYQEALEMYREAQELVQDDQEGAKEVSK